MSDTPNADSVPSPEPIVTTPLPRHGGAPACPFCGYRCGCCCFHGCQTPCPTPDEDGDCSCDLSCHGGHEPWDCGSFSTRYDWARRKAEAALIAGAAMSDTTDRSVLVSVELLESIVDDEDCWFDHHGGCQAHGYLRLEPGELCPQRELKDLLASVNDAEPTGGSDADVLDERERVARIVYAFGYANGAFMWPWESASSEAQQDARSHADAILDGHVVVDADTLAALAVDHTGGWCPQRRSHKQHCGDCTACAHRALVERARALLEGGNHG